MHSIFPISSLVSPLPALEFLARPHPKEGHGVFGGGWERPKDMFAAAKNLAEKLERQEQELERELRSRGPSGDEGTKAETEAQAEARRRAGQEFWWKCHVSTEYAGRG